MPAQQNSRRRKNSQNDARLTSDHGPATRTIGKVFSDGTSIELIREAATGRISLSSFDGKSHTVGNRVEAHGQLYLPAQIDPSILRAVGGDYLDATDLLELIADKEVRVLRCAQLFSDDRRLRKRANASQTPES